MLLMQRELKNGSNRLRSTSLLRIIFIPRKWSAFMQFTSQQMTYFFNCNQGVTFFIMREDTQILLWNFIKITEKYSTLFFTTISTAMLKIHKTLFEHILCFSSYFIRKKELFHYLLFCKLFTNSVQ